MLISDRVGFFIKKILVLFYFWGFPYDFKFSIEFVILGWIDVVFILLDEDGILYCKLPFITLPYNNFLDSSFLFCFISLYPSWYTFFHENFVFTILTITVPTNANLCFVLDSIYPTPP